MQSAHYLRAEELRGFGDLTGAIAAYTRALRDAPEDVALFALRAWCYYSLGDRGETLADCRQVRTMQSEGAFAAQAQAIVMMSIGDAQRALEEANAAIALDPGRGHFYALRASIYQHLGEQIKADNDSEKAMRMGCSRGTIIPREKILPEPEPNLIRRTMTALKERLTWTGILTSLLVLLLAFFLGRALLLSGLFPHASPTASPSTQPIALNITATEQSLINQTNASRIKAGLRPLQVDPRLVAIAEGRSRDMLKRHYFAHHIPGAGNVFDILRSKHIPFLSGGENILKGELNTVALPAGVAALANTDFLNSTAHRENILNPRYDHVGIGIAVGSNHLIYITEVFTQQTPPPAH